MRFFFIFVFIISFLFSSSTWAEDFQDDNTLPLTLDDVVSCVIEFNPVVQSARLEWLIACKEEQAAQGDFEPDLVANYEIGTLERQNNAVEKLNQWGNAEFFEDTEKFGSGLEGKIPTGAQYWIGYSMEDADNNVSKTDEYTSFAGIKLQQPLLKNAWFGTPMKEINVAKKDREVAFQTYRSELLNNVLRVQAAYWDLAYSQEKCRIEQESLNIAEKLVEDSKARLKTGKMSQMDLFDAEAGYAIRKSNLVDSQISFFETMKKLKLLLSTDKIIDDISICASDMFLIPDFQNINNDDSSLDDYLYSHPDYLSRKKTLEKEKILVAHKKDQVLPQLDFTCSYGYNSLDDYEVGSWKGLEDRNYQEWSCGLVMRIPLVGTTERNQLEAEKLRQEKAAQDLKATEYALLNTMKVLDYSVDGFKKRVKQIQIMKDFKKRSLDAELKAFQLGKSNVRKIYEMEDQLADTCRQELELILSYRKSLLQLDAVRGNLLRKYGLETIKGDEVIMSNVIKK